MIFDTAAEVASRDDFPAQIDREVLAMEQTAALRAIRDGRFGKADYQRVLCRLFHQVYSSAGTFSLAAAHCSARYQSIREYLIQHAEEEKAHWRWILDDLEAMNYQGPRPDKTLPSAATLSYVAFNHYIAVHRPIARLGIAAMLEKLGATLSRKYAGMLVRSAGLQANEVSFFLGHGETDVGHVEQIMNVLDDSALSAEDWGWMVCAAKTGGMLYRSMWDAG